MKLTPREIEVVILLARDLSVRQAAELLGVSSYTARTHRKHAKLKLGVHGAAGFALYAVRRGWIDAGGHVLPHCRQCGCTDEQPCQGEEICQWADLPGDDNRALCTFCAADLDRRALAS